MKGRVMKGRAHAEPCAEQDGRLAPAAETGAILRRQLGEYPRPNRLGKLAAKIGV